MIKDGFGSPDFHEWRTREHDERGASPRQGLHDSLKVSS